MHNSVFHRKPNVASITVLILQYLKTCDDKDPSWINRNIEQLILEKKSSIQILPLEQ